MFEDFIGLDSKKEEKKQLDAEERQQQFSTEQIKLQGATHPEDDSNYLQQQDNKSDLIRWQQELEPEMYNMILSFLSLKEDEEGKPVPIVDDDGQKIKPLCNKTFIHQVIEPMLRPFLSKNLVNSNLDKDEIMNAQKHTANDLTDAMADNWDKYGIEFVNYPIIIRDIKNIMRPSIWRAYKGWTKKTDSSIIKRIESENFGTLAGNEETKKGLKALFSS